MLKKIIIGIVVLIVGFFLYAATRPDTFHIQRMTSIKAAPEKIFPLINDFRSWSEWSPWEKMDPAMKRAYGGSESGRGSTYAWEGNSKVGKGRMEIVTVAPPSMVEVKLDFEKPMEGHNMTTFTLEGKGDSTFVTWAMHGPSPYVAKVMSIFLSMDRMVGKDFEAGLASLKALAEK